MAKTRQDALEQKRGHPLPLPQRKSKEPEAPCAGIPIKFAHIAWTPKQYANLKCYADTVGHATVMDKRELIAYRESGLEHPTINKYSSCLGACMLDWQNKPVKYLIVETMRICFQLLFFDYGIDKKDVFNILYSIKETRYILNDDVFNFFGVECPGDEESEAYVKFLNKLYGVKHGKA